MGTIVIEEYGRSGTPADNEVPVTRLDQLLARTEDATTSSTAESLVLKKGTTLIRVYTEEIHRLCVGSDTTASIYLTTEAQKWMDLGVRPESTFYFELDA